MEQFLQTLLHLDPWIVLLALFGFALIENLFPPSPSDMVIVCGGSLVGLGVIGFVPALLASTAGSVLGFVIMYKIGDWFGDHILERYRPKFLPLESIHKVEGWFRSHGYWLIVANRFLSGTRAVVSFFAGMSELRLDVTVLLSLVSAAIWNGLLLAAGYSLGKNWEQIGIYLDTYSAVVTALLAAAAVFFVVRWMRARKRRGTAT